MARASLAAQLSELREYTARLEIELAGYKAMATATKPARTGFQLSPVSQRRKALAIHFRTAARINKDQEIELYSKVRGVWVAVPTDFVLPH